MMTSLVLVLRASPQSRRGVDYDEMLQQKRREERSYREGSGPQVGGLRGSSSEVQLHQGGLQDQLDALSGAVSEHTAHTCVIEPLLQASLLF